MPLLDVIFPYLVFIQFVEM